MLSEITRRIEEFRTVSQEEPAGLSPDAIADTAIADDTLSENHITALARSPAITAAIDHLVHQAEEPLGLDQLAERVGLSPYHFQRAFKRRVGLSPKRFQQYLAVNHAKRLLDGDASVLDAALEIGLSGPSRLHDLFVACEAMTPGEYKSQGAALTVRWGIHDAPFGRALIGLTERGVCWLGFVPEAGEAAAIAEFEDEWGLARLSRDQAATGRIAEAIFSAPPQAAKPVTLLLRGTNFQIKVWEALLSIPPGAVCSYGTLARSIGRPGAGRAVGAAVGANLISYLIPCHRVILGSGVVHRYRWGTVRKQALLAWEAGMTAPRAA
ncbi:MAG: methylated-DNA--[protein]-cysteine S-methyltransferase [Azospirillaceae bacterium]